MPVLYKKAKITKADKENYKKSPGKFCPLCGTEGSLQYVEEKRNSTKYPYKIYYACMICDRRFVELYKLVDVVETLPR